MAEVKIGEETFNVEVEGAGPAVVLSNALGTALSMWDVQMPALLKHFRVVRYDPRGHGAGACEAPVSLDRLGRDVLAILDATGIERTHFIGLSMGGAVGQWLLANAPERLDRAVLANTAPHMGSSASWNARIRRVLAGDRDGNAEATVDRWFSDAFRQTYPEAVEAVRDAVRRQPAAGYAACCAALRDMDLRDPPVRAIAVARPPVLVISGSDDPSVGADGIAALLAIMPGARHVSLPARHLSNIEAADAFNEAVVKFLTGRVSARAARGARTASSFPPDRANGARAPARIPGRRDATTNSAASARRSLATAPTAETKAAAKRAAKTAAEISAEAADRPEGAGSAGGSSLRRRAAKAPPPRGRAGKTARGPVPPSTRAKTSSRRGTAAGSASPPSAKKPLSAAAMKARSRAARAADIVPSRRATPAASARAGKAGTRTTDTTGAAPRKGSERRAAPASMSPAKTAPSKASPARPAAGPTSAGKITADRATSEAATRTATTSKAASAKAAGTKTAAGRTARNRTAPVKAVPAKSGTRMEPGKTVDKAASKTSGAKTPAPRRKPAPSRPRGRGPA